MKKLILFLLLLSSVLYAQDTLTIASFNIQIFGKTKSSKPDIMDTLSTIIKKYDLVAIQEIKDASGVTVPRLLNYLNSNSGNTYKVLLSERTGKQPDDQDSQEQYLYVYNSTKIHPIDTVFIEYTIANYPDKMILPASVYNDDQDNFQREPYIAFFQVRNSPFRFTLANIHTRPESAYEEIDALLAIGNELNEYYRFIDTQNTSQDPDLAFLKNVIMLGDYNADCSYLSDSEIHELKDKYTSLHWLIPEDTKTNFSPNSDCTYDRIVITKDMIGHITGEFGVDKSFYSKSVSDHYPIWYKFIY